MEQYEKSGHMSANVTPAYDPNYGSSDVINRLRIPITLDLFRGLQWEWYPRFNGQISEE